jgi:Uma2 family endonuclease
MIIETARRKLMVATVPRDIESALDDRHEGSEQSIVLLQPVTWQTYQALLSDLGDHRAARLSYDRGILEIKMPSKLHELVNRLLERIITTLTEELDLNVVSLGSTRFDQESEDQGVEPDSCFYIQNADRLDPMDPQPPQDFPPDLVVEVDITSSSRSRLPIYQAMGVPEIWCYNRKGLTILRWDAAGYQSCEMSEVFPFLSAEMLSEWVTQGRQSQNHNLLIKVVRDRVRQEI